MGKKTVGWLTTGLFVALATTACGGGADDTAGSSAPVVEPPAAPTTSAPAPAAPVTENETTEAPPPPAEAAAPAAPAQAQGGLDPALVAQGKQAFATSVCVSCHGPTATGTPLAPDLTDDEHLWVQPGPNAVTETAALIKAGVPTPKDPSHVAPMPPYGGIPLSDDQVNALAAYVVSLSQ